MTPDQFLARATANLAAHGNTVSAVALPGGAVTVGYQHEFRIAWFATKLHLFTVLAVRPEATVDGLARLSQESIAYAKQTKGRLRGFQSGVAAMPILAAPVVAPGVRELVQGRPPKGFAAIVMPAVVDLSSGEISCYEGRLVLGSLYTKWLRARMARALTFDEAV